MSGVGLEPLEGTRAITFPADTRLARLTAKVGAAPPAGSGGAAISVAEPFPPSAVGGGAAPASAILKLVSRKRPLEVSPAATAVPVPPRQSPSGAVVSAPTPQSADAGAGAGVAAKVTWRKSTGRFVAAVGTGAGADADAGAGAGAGAGDGDGPTLSATTIPVPARVFSTQQSLAAQKQRELRSERDIRFVVDSMIARIENLSQVKKKRPADAADGLESGDGEDIAIPDEVDITTPTSLLTPQQIMNSHRFLAVRRMEAEKQGKLSSLERLLVNECSSYMMVILKRVERIVAKETVAKISVVAPVPTVRKALVETFAPRRLRASLEDLLAVQERVLSHINTEVSRLISAGLHVGTAATFAARAVVSSRDVNILLQDVPFLAPEQQAAFAPINNYLALNDADTKLPLSSSNPRWTVTRQPYLFT